MPRLTWDEQDLLMARLVSNPSEFKAARDYGITTKDWSSDDMRRAWDVLCENQRDGREHEIMGFYTTVQPYDHDFCTNVLLELATACPTIRYRQTDLGYHLSQLKGQ